MKIGFTGARTTRTKEQLRWLQNRLAALECTEFHHGDCLGADSQAHDIAHALGIWIVVHPPTISTFRAFRESGQEYRQPFDFLVRNKHIVDETTMLLALPDGPERLRSGTWSTIRYARLKDSIIEVKMP